MSGLQNGGHGRRIVEDKIVVSKRSQVPVSKTLRWTGAEQVPAAVGRSIKLKTLKASNPRAEKLHKADTSKVKPNRKKQAAYLGGGVLVGTAAGAALAQPLKKPIRAMAMRRDVARAGKVLGVAKAQRYYDPEHRRQRRIGIGEAGLLAAGGLLGRKSIKGIRSTTKLIRGGKVTSAAGGEVVPTKLRAATNRQLLELGGATTAVGGAGALNYHGNHPRGKAWR